MFLNYLSIFFNINIQTVQNCCKSSSSPSSSSLGLNLFFHFFIHCTVTEDKGDKGYSICCPLYLLQKTTFKGKLRVVIH